MLKKKKKPVVRILTNPGFESFCLHLGSDTLMVLLKVARGKKRGQTMFLVVKSAKRQTFPKPNLIFGALFPNLSDVKIGEGQRVVIEHLNGKTLIFDADEYEEK